MEIGNDTICFLDLKISIVQNQLFTTVYSKPTDSHMNLHATSCHSKQSIVGIQKGVALRLRRICSTLEEYNLKSKEYSSFLIERGHDSTKVKETFNSVRSMLRSDARKKVVHPNDNKRIIFSTKFNPLGPNVKKIVNDNLYLLQNSEVLKDLYPPAHILVANKRENNLKELVLRGDPYTIKSDCTDNSDHGYTRCNKRCDSCSNFVDEVTYVKCSATGRSSKFEEVPLVPQRM